MEKFGYLGWPYEDKVKGDTGQCDSHTDQGIQGSWDGTQNHQSDGRKGEEDRQNNVDLSVQSENQTEFNGHRM